MTAQKTDTPFDTNPNTPLDALKAAFLRSHEHIGYALDGLIGTLNVADDSAEVAALDEATFDLGCLVREQLGMTRPERNWVPRRENEPELYRYDNGAPVLVTLNNIGHAVAHVWPRFDTAEMVAAHIKAAIEIGYRELQDAPDGEAAQ